MSYFYDKPEYILAIAEEGNISRAAEKLFISQSTLTMYLNRVEQDFGAALFNRSVRPVTPTKAGLLYIDSLRSVQHLEKEFREGLDRIINPGEMLNIGIGPIRSRIYLPFLVQELRTLRPGISISASEQSDPLLPAGLRNGTHDVIFGSFSLANMEDAVLHVCVFWSIGVILLLVVAPAVASCSYFKTPVR